MKWQTLFRPFLKHHQNEAKRQGAKEFRASYRKKNMASKGMIEACSFKFDFESEEKTDPRNGEKYTVINCKKALI